MACNCKVTQNIDYLHKKYGDNIPQSKRTNIRGSVIAGIENTVLYALMVPLLPFMAVYAIFKVLNGKPIHIDKLVNITQNGRN